MLNKCVPIVDIEYIVFDWDNTIADTSIQMKKVMDQTIETLVNKGIYLKTSLKSGYWNKNLSELMHFKSPHLLVEGKLIYDKFMSQSSDNDVKIFEGTINLLNFLKSKGKKLFIISNKEETLLHKQVKGCKLWPYFEKISGPCSTNEISKPSAKVFPITIGMDILPHMVLLIGDSQVDEETAKNFGCKFIYVNNIGLDTFYDYEEQTTNLNRLLSYFKNSYTDVQYDNENFLRVPL